MNPLSATTTSGSWSSFRHHLACEAKVFWATPVTVVFIVLMPVVLYAIFGFAFKDHSSQIVSMNGVQISAANRSFAGVLTFGLMSVGFANVAIGLAMRRTSGVFRRLRTTAANPAVVVAAHVVNVAGVAVILVVVIALMGLTMFSVDIPVAHVLPLIAVLLAALVSFVPLGIAVSLLPTNADNAVPMVNAVFFPLAFLSGAFFDIPLGSIGDTIIASLPVRPVVNLLVAQLSANGAVDPWNLAVLGGWSLVGIVIAARWFRWSAESEPQASRRTRRRIARASAPIPS